MPERNDQGCSVWQYEELRVWHVTGFIFASVMRDGDLEHANAIKDCREKLKCYLPNFVPRQELVKKRFRSTTREIPGLPTAPSVVYTLSKATELLTRDALSLAEFKDHEHYPVVADLLGEILAVVREHEHRRRRIPSSASREPASATYETSDSNPEKAAKVEDTRSPPISKTTPLPQTPIERPLEQARPTHRIAPDDELPAPPTAGGLPKPGEDAAEPTDQSEFTGIDDSTNAQSRTSSEPVERFSTDALFEERVAMRLRHQRGPSRPILDSNWIDTLCLDELEALPVAAKGPQLTRGRGPSRGELIRTFHLDSQPRCVYLIGDVHGDLLALESCIECIQKQHDRQNNDIPTSNPADARRNCPTVVLLGDLIDDGPESLLVLRRVLDWARETRLVLIPGNHDLALKKSRGHEPAYRAEVSPSQFTEELNDPQRPMTDEDRNLVDHFIQYCEEAPAALVLPDGSLAVHGGVPHVDLHEDLLAWFRAAPNDRPELPNTVAECVREDFAWGRIHPKAKRKIADRSVRGQELGVEDVTKSLDVLGELLGGRRPTRIIRGHDHVERRWDIPKKHQGRVITINAMSYRQGREHLGPPTRKPIVARWETGGPDQAGTVTLLQIDLDEAFVQANAPELRERRMNQGRESLTEMASEPQPKPESSGTVDP